MSWFLRLRGVHWSLISAALVIGWSVLVPSLAFTFPTLFASGQLGSTRIANVISLVPELLWLWGIARSRGPGERTGSTRRGLWAIDLTTPVLSIALATVLLALTPTVDLESVWRNFCLFFALAMIAHLVLPQTYAFILPTGYLLLSMLVGFRPFDPQPRSWALVLMTAPDISVDVVSIAAFAVGLVVYAAGTLWRSLTR